MRVTALTRNAAKSAGLRAAGIATVVADLADPEWHARLPGGAEFALNLREFGGGGLPGYERSYLQGMASILEWRVPAAERGRSFITSSTSVYPQGGGVCVE